MHPEISEEYVKALALGFALMAATLGFAPVARADMNLGNYEVQWSRPWDFHTWVLQITQCVPPSGAGALLGCVKVSANPRPIARALQWRAVAPLENGRYTFTVDVPEGLLCGGYYGPSAPTRDTYSWDEKTLTGTMESAIAEGACGPARTDTYPFALIRM